MTVIQADDGSFVIGRYVSCVPVWRIAWEAIVSSMCVCWQY